MLRWERKKRLYGRFMSQSNMQVRHYDDYDRYVLLERYLHQLFIFSMIHQLYIFHFYIIILQSSLSYN